MAFVRGYKHDIFVTYAHVDDMPLPGEDRGWVTMLVRNLDRLLSQSLGRTDAYSLWMDRELGGNEPFTETIQSNVRQSATLLAIVSPGYLASEWCRREGNAFMEELERRRGDRQSVFVIETTSVDTDVLPIQFQELVRYRFWVKDHEGATAHPLGFRSATASDTQYYERLYDLAQDIVRTLKALAESTSPSGLTSVATPISDSPEIDDIPEEIQQQLNQKLEDGMYDVFMCHNSEDKEEVKRVGRMLMKQGYLPWLETGI